MNLLKKHAIFLKNKIKQKLKLERDKRKLKEHLDPEELKKIKRLMIEHIKCNSEDYTKPLKYYETLMEDFEKSKEDALVMDYIEDHIKSLNDNNQIKYYLELLDLIEGLKQ